jgi:hypothetical protein
MFRGMNEQIRLLVTPFESLPQRRPIPFVCECRSEHCFAAVVVSLLEYQAVCADDEHRLILPGHQVEGEEVVIQTPTYAVVRVAEVTAAGSPAAEDRIGVSR